jgi:methionyl-tRNA formyltransferase
MISAGWPPALIITIPDDKQMMHSDYVDMEAIARPHGIEVLKTLNVEEAAILTKVSAIQPDFIFVIGWSRLCGQQFRDCARDGVLGFHPTKLPAMRGRAALAWTIILGLEETAGSLFWIDEGTDTGPLAAQRVFPIPVRADIATLLDLQMGGLRNMMREITPMLRAGKIPAVPQDHALATYVAVRRPDDGQIDWRQPAEAIDRLVRALSKPYPGAFTPHGNRGLVIWKAEPVERNDWIAQTGQVFMHEGDAPLVRCGKDTTLKLLDYVIMADGVATEARLNGQPVLGRQKK